MKAILVRIGVDHSYGAWNAPADPTSRRFVYVPIPEKPDTRFHPGCKRIYRQILPSLHQFAADHGLNAVADLGWPTRLEPKPMHLDPDFDYLTYGDVGHRRGSHIRTMKHGDLIVFYAGLRSIRPDDTHLIYALVGLFLVDEVVPAADVSKSHWDMNAHTRKLKRGASDIVVRAVRAQSGRFARFLPIGEFRDRAYRVRRDLLKKWGGLTVRNGYLQRSARPPRFLQPQRFLAWLDHQNVDLIASNNPTANEARVVLVHLRRPRLSNPNEMRSDPFWEFGSFGCTGCHSSNLMNPARIDELEGVRFAFAQGGPSGVRLVKLTAPVTIVKHPRCAEVRWTPASMPLRYDAAPLLVDNHGKSDFERLLKMIVNVNRSTWVSRFASKFRSSRQLLPRDVAEQLIAVFSRQIQRADASAVSRSYVEALPFPPPHVDTDRERTFGQLLATIRKTPRRSVRSRNVEHRRPVSKRRRC